MKYDLIKTDLGLETISDENGNYSINITIALHPTDGVAPDFSKDIVDISNNSMTGFEVDEQRKTAVENYIAEINKD